MLRNSKNKSLENDGIPVIRSAYCTSYKSLLSCPVDDSMINLICKMKRIWLVASNHVSSYEASYHYSIHLAYPFIIGHVLIEIRKLLQFPTPGKFSVFISVFHDLVATRIFESQAFVDAFFLCRKYPYSSILVVHQVSLLLKQLPWYISSFL